MFQEKSRGALGAESLPSLLEPSLLEFAWQYIEDYNKL